MPQDRTTRSNAPSPSSRYSVPSVHTLLSSPILFLPKPQSRNIISHTVNVPRLSQPPSPSTHPLQSSQPRASATHNPSLPLIFHWRCCLSGCSTKNTHFTAIHFTRLRVRRLLDMWYWTPSYRVSKCRECQHQACEMCILLQVKGESEWKGEKLESGFRETGDVGVWKRIGIWGEGSGDDRES